MPQENMENITPPLSSQEGELKPKGFHIEIKQPDEIIKAIREGTSGILGEQSSDNLINHIKVALKNGEENFDLFAKLTMPAMINNPHKEPEFLAWAAKSIYPTLKHSYPIEQHNGRYILTGPNGTKFIIGSNTKFKEAFFEISTGTIQEIDKTPEQVFPGPEKTQENISPAIQDFTGVLKTCVKNIYGLDGKVPPDGKLVLHPPIEQIKEDRGDKNRRFLKTLRPITRNKIV